MFSLKLIESLGFRRDVLRRIAHLVLAVIAAATLAGCGAGGGATKSAKAAQPLTLRLGYFPNLTHAAALVGVREGILAKALAPNAKLQTATFNAGPAEVQALFAGALDAAYLGPSAAVSAFEQSHGAAITVVSGATSGGAALVVKPAITTPAQLKGAKLATPQLGNTQDVALRYWLRDHALKADTLGGGDVAVLPQANSTAVTAFQTGAINGGWLPEPYATQLVQAGGHVLVDERSLWPDGRFPTTLLAVRTDFLRRHPAAVTALLKGHVEATDFVNRHPDQAQGDVAAEIAAITGKAPSAKVISAAWPSLAFTTDPLAAAIQTAADHAAAVGLAKPIKLAKLVDVTLLNRVTRR
jgi:NitT/TauT family transport system substrate-binding protein